MRIFSLNLKFNIIYKYLYVYIYVYISKLEKYNYIIFKYYKIYLRIIKFK
jgi:type IV secretory pathway TraG/TraD family ATPase VirD4